MDGPSVADSLKGKGEADLFRELLRHLPTVQLEDYYKNGIWQNEVMKLDIQIVEAHRREAGAPDPLEPDEIPSFEVPIQPKPLLASIRPATIMAPLRPPTTGSVISPRPPGQNAGTTTPAAPAGLLRPPQKVSLRPVAIPAKAAGMGKEGSEAGTPWGPSSDVQQLAIVGARWKLNADRARALLALQLATFASKWQLEAGRTQAMLAPLVAERRQFVMENFQVAPGEEATAKLEQFIVECQRSGSWNGGNGPAAKRPWDGGSGQGLPKRFEAEPGFQAREEGGVERQPEMPGPPLENGVPAIRPGRALEQSETFEPPLRAKSLWDLETQEWRPCEVIAYYRADQQYLIRWPCGTLKQAAVAHVVVEGEQASSEECPEEGWQYLDAGQNVQGPFSRVEMEQWHAKGYITSDIRMRCCATDPFAPFSELFPPPLTPFRSYPRRPRPVD